MKRNVKYLFLFIFMLFLNSQADEIQDNDDTKEVNNADYVVYRRRHRHCCCGPRGPQGPQGPQGPAGSSSSLEYAYIYSTVNSVIAPGSSVPFDQNGPMSSNIVHSTTSNTDQVIINRAGVYRVVYNITSSGSMYFAISINGVVQTSSQYGTNTGGTILAGSAIITVSSGDIIRITNYSLATTTTLSNLSAGNPRISASITIRQDQ